ncbi:uncharacterized protein LOC132201151 [Neocloeon triangulifer]|uniref:uncharacterized protein LOC132201151 n=1 Tax=Neocloeon triangulifer TaxID=2078957 RepID=UPI00286FAC6A|nr:uncharacterized protein LOC132201151 [Neocloeon triangulifer]
MHSVLCLLLLSIIFSAVADQDQMRFICPSNGESIEELSATLLKRMDDFESNLSAELGRVLPEIQTLQNFVNANGENAKSSETEIFSKLIGMESNYLKIAEDLQKKLYKKFDDLAISLDSVKGETILFGEKVNHFELSYLESMERFGKKIDDALKNLTCNVNKKKKDL